MSFEIKQDMPAPVYVIQFIYNASTNHRMFLSQINMDQLKGKVISKEIAEKECGNYAFNKDIYSKFSWGNHSLNPFDIASPCGIKAQSFFNDTFTLYYNG